MTRRVQLGVLERLVILHTLWKHQFGSANANSHTTYLEVQELRVRIVTAVYEVPPDFERLELFDGWLCLAKQRPF